jgi:signal transduction histidine kinase/DNA-binding response OmpR family regulator
MVDRSGNLWLGTLNAGIIQIEEASFINSKEKINQKVFNDGINVLRSSSMITTSKNTCWVATFNEGVYEFNIDANPFNFYNSKMNYPFGLNSNNVNHIAPLDKDRAYLSSPLGDMALFNTQNQTFEPIMTRILSDLSPKITTIFVDSKKNSWIRIFGSRDLYRIKEGNSQYDVIPLNSLILTDNLALIRSFTEDKYGNIWIGTNNDVYKVSINEKNDVVSLESLNETPFFSNDKLSLARFVYADPLHDFIWIGADSDGLFRIKNQNSVPLKKLSVSQFVRNENTKFSLSSNFVTSIIRLPNDELWIGTEGGGVCKVVDSELEPKFIAYTEKNGLSNNVVKNILFDDEYNLWISTNIGLNKLNTKDFSIRKFNMSDGLPFEDFWFEAKRLKNGVMLMSGLDGFCYFNPNDVQSKEKLPKVVFENLKIFNKTVKPGDTIHNRVLLKTRIADLDEIELKYNENVFSLDLTSLHFSNPENHAIKYRMEPINKEWVEVPSNRNTIEYSGLQPGKYELSVMASNSLNEWTPPKKIKILITPPFWNTNLAYVIYFLSLILTIYLIRRVELRIQALKYKVEIEQLEIDKVNEVNEAKLQFFSNISHEIKTPLTLISVPIKMLLERYKGNADIADKLHLVERQSNKINELIEQVHDFRKADANLLKMNYTRFNFNEFIEELITDFKYGAKNDHKVLKLNHLKSVIIVSADKEKLEKILNNLINNALKYTRTKDTIKIEYKSVDKDLILSIKDTGKGIDKIDLEHVFERFYQSHKQENVHKSGSGIGLAFSKKLVEMHYGYINIASELNVGTEVSIRLPIVKKQSANEKLQHTHIVLPNEEEIDKELIEKKSSQTIKSSGEFSESLIFYAEDNTEMRKFVSSQLSKFFKVKSFRNGQECLDAMENEWPDIVISDIQMPELSGLDLCIRIKSDLKTSHIPVVLLTALTNINDHIQGIKDGADAYIKKPFNFQLVITSIEALLTNRKQLRERFQVGIPLTKENTNSRNDNAFLDKLYSLMEGNLDNQNIDLNHIAKQLYLNRTHFYKKVKDLTDLTPFEILKNYRLKKASELLGQEQLSVNEVFVMIGFKDRTHFAKAFKAKYGVSPSKYAQSIKA